MKVFLVDDTPVCNFIATIIIKDVCSSCEIFSFTNPEQAYTMLSKEVPDLIFLDINMPVMDGFEFLDKMQQENNLTRVYMLTSSCNDKDRQRSFKYANVIDFMPKPPEANKIERVFNLR